jgi:phenylpyruvate tautomerase PptA (4-oxalocrotonate tautomerase family)
MDELEDIYLDDEGNFVATADGDVKTITGVDVIFQDVKHELITELRSLWLHPDYGSRVQRFRQAENTAINRQELIQEVKLVIQRHPNVDAASIEVIVEDWTSHAINLIGSFLAQNSATQTQERVALVIVMDQDGIRVLRG